MVDTQNLIQQGMRIGKDTVRAARENDLGSLLPKHFFPNIETGIGTQHVMEVERNLIFFEFLMVDESSH